METLHWGAPSFWIERFPLYYGRQEGFFRRRGIRLRIEILWGGPELAHAVDDGRIGIGEMGLPPFLHALSHGLPASLIGSSIIQQLDHYLVSRLDVETMRDLRGRRLGILSFGSCDEYFARRLLEVFSVDPDEEVVLVPLGDSYGQLEPFSSGRIDAGFMVEPYIALAESEGLVRVLSSVKPYFPRYQWGILFARDDWLAQRSNLIQRALDAYRESCQAIQEDPEAAVPLGAQAFEVSETVFRRALYRDLGNWETEARIDPEGMENCLAIQREIGAVNDGLRPSVWEALQGGSGLGGEGQS